MSERIRVAMCITTVPSAWNADAIASRSKPDRSSAHSITSRGCASSKALFSAASSMSGRREAVRDTSAEYRPVGFRRLADPPEGALTMSNTFPIAPHGGELVNLVATGDEAERIRQEAPNLPKVVVSERELADLEMLATGALS